MTPARGTTTDIRLPELTLAEIRKGVRAARMREKRSGALRCHRVRMAVRAMYALRRCFVCNRLGCCQHREPEVEVAFLGALEQAAILRGGRDA